jgi:hypothetical protein
MLLRSHERLPLITPAIELALWAARLLFTPCLLVVAELGLFSLILGPRAVFQMDWVLGVVVITVVPIYLGLNRLSTINDAIEKFILKLKRSVVLSCPWVSAKDITANWQAACFFVLNEFMHPIFRCESQQAVVDQVLKHLQSDQAGGVRFVYIEGDSGQGKTRTIFLLIHALLKHRELFDIANRAFLYDMSLGPRTQSNLERRLDSITHDNALVFVDNFHRVEPKVLSTITHRLLDTAGPSSERLVVLLGQPSYAWRIRPTAEVRLVSIARRESTFFKLSGVRSRSIADELEGRPGSDIWRRVFKLSESQTASVPQVQFAQAIRRSKGKQLALTQELIELIETTPGPTGDRYNDLTSILAIITALSLYRGWFTRKEFARICWENPPHKRRFSRLAYSAKMFRMLRRLTRIGLVTRVSAPSRQFVFHEVMAEHCKDHLAANPTFWTHFCAAVKSRLNRPEGQESMIRWLLSTELHDTATMEQIFDHSLLSGTLSPMVRCLDRNWKNLQDSSAIRYEYAMLLDQVGRFAQSREIFAGLESELVEKSALAGRVQLARVEVDHTPDSYNWLATVSNQPDAANKIAAEYWRIHLDAHRGIFQPDELAAIAERMGQSFEAKDFQQSHFLVHQAARVFFDAHRHIYLSGHDVEGRLQRLRDLPIEGVLREHLPQFRAFAILYREAHLLAHHHIPELEFSAKMPDPTLLPGNATTGDRFTANLVSMAHDAYSRAQDEFALYGDREYLYLQADILNLEMLSKALSKDPDVESLRPKLIDYEGFIRKSAFNDILSYPAFYFFRWHMLKYFLWLKNGNEGQAKAEAEQNLEFALQYLQKAKDFDLQCENSYGVWRSEFFFGLLNGLKQASANILLESLRTSKSDAERLGYFRDVRIIKSLLDQSKVTFLDLRRVVLFFPFVHQ